MSPIDIVVVGGGNAALCAAIAARLEGASVTLLEAAPFERRGGNSWFTDGAIRFAHGGLDEVREIIPEMSDEEASRIDLPPFPSEAFESELMSMSGGKADRGLVAMLASESLTTMRWLREQSVRFAMIYDNQAFERDGAYRFWGGLSVKSVGRGIGLVDTLFRRAETVGVEIHYGRRVRRLVPDDGLFRVESEVASGVPARSEEADTASPPGPAPASEAFTARAVVLACGGFEANADLRRKHLGEPWRDAVVRGTEFNQGDGLEMAQSLGGARVGSWSGCHAIATDAGAPPYGDRGVPGDIYKKHSYPLGIVVNREGRRFLDEGLDFRNHTYARYGRAILSQPGGVAFQIFDQQVVSLLREEYGRPEATVFRADTLAELADRMGVDPRAFEDTVDEYNRSVGPGAFNPERKDGKAAAGVVPPKSNWALPLSEPPFLAYPVMCAITFTFGGVAVDDHGRVLTDEREPIPGVYAAGEMVGNLFFDNYPGGSGLISGATFGRRAGQHAGRWTR